MIHKTHVCVWANSLLECWHECKHECKCGFDWNGTDNVVLALAAVPTLARATQALESQDLNQWDTQRSKSIYKKKPLKPRLHKYCFVCQEPIKPKRVIKSIYTETPRNPEPENQMIFEVKAKTLVSVNPVTSTVTSLSTVCEEKVGNIVDLDNTDGLESNPEGYSEIFVNSDFCSFSYWQKDDGKWYGHLKRGHKTGYLFVHNKELSEEGDLGEGYMTCENCGATFSADEFDANSYDRYGGEQLCRPCIDNADKERMKDEKIKLRKKTLIQKWKIKMAKRRIKETRQSLARMSDEKELIRWATEPITFSRKRSHTKKYLKIGTVLQELRNLWLDRLNSRDGINPSMFNL